MSVLKYVNKYDIMGFIATFIGVEWRRSLTTTNTWTDWQDWMTIFIICLGIWLWCRGKMFTPSKPT